MSVLIFNKQSGQKPEQFVEGLLITGQVHPWRCMGENKEAESKQLMQKVAHLASKVDNIEKYNTLCRLQGAFLCTISETESTELDIHVVHPKHLGRMGLSSQTLSFKMEVATFANWSVIL